MPKNQFVQGDTVRWNWENFNKDYWDGLSEDLRVKYYGKYGYEYGDGKYDPKTITKLFTFLCHHRPQHGHCVLVSMDDQKVYTMCHTSEFDLVSDEDC